MKVKIAISDFDKPTLLSDTCDMISLHRTSPNNGDFFLTIFSKGKKIFEINSVYLNELIVSD